ncbi:GH3 auxin-responsive promoter family protein [Rubrivirga sp.]|uniref:GH3 auxin-responsive promoter family protein n=1 Tax=Rubrivirga sp. TaxID=1885344 RepID=UPI003B52EF2F
MRARLANAAWALAARPAATAFHRALADPERAQTRLLHSILRANADTVVGRAHGFGQIRTLREFQDAVPLVGWDEVAPFVERIAAGEPNVLTSEPVRLLEPTGGSSGGTKLVPYTRTLQRQIRAAVAPWVADLFRHVPAAAHGPAYWSVSPAVPHERTAGGVPVGFEDDGAYLSPLHRTLARATLAAPSALRHVADPEAFRYATLRWLVARRDLALVSVWNPTFLALLLCPLRDWADRLADDLDRGTLSADVPPAVRAGLDRDSARARDLRRLAAGTTTDADLVAGLWPRLALVSAWADGHAAGPADDLRALVPQAAFQAKGLLATEGVVTVPLWGRDGGAPALTSHVLEFVPESGGRPVFAHHVETGERYGVVLTTGGGLYRYRLGDTVEAVGRVAASPLLRFVGREGPVSDRVGEKLHEGHVARALAGLGLGGFALVAPDGDARPCRYVLFTDGTASDARLAQAARRLDAALVGNVHYALARRLGQLGPVAAFRIRDGGATAFLEGCVALGQRLGDVKSTALHRDGGWAGRFDGAFVSAES